jgi:uncharacterized protein with beta-barrel porin domain
VFVGSATISKAQSINCSTYSSTSTLSSGGAVGPTIIGVPAGTVFTAVISNNPNNSLVVLADNFIGGNVLAGPSTSVLTYTHDGVRSYLWARFSAYNGSVTVNFTCTSPAPASSSSASNVRSIQLAGTQVSSTTAANSLATGIASNVGNRLPLAPGAAPNAGVGSPSFLGARNRDSSVKDTPADKQPTRAFNAWGDVKQSGFDRDDQTSMKQVSAMGGIDYLLYPNLLLGVMGGYEHSDFKVDTLQSSLKGNGNTVGVYGGYRFTPS